VQGSNSKNYLKPSFSGMLQCKNRVLGARKVPFGEVYSLPEVFLLNYLGGFQSYIRSKYSCGEYHLTIIGFSQFRFGHRCDTNDGSSFRESVMVCNFVNRLFRSLRSILLGTIFEADLAMGEELDE
jgi:hypothetical protein